LSVKAVRQASKFSKYGLSDNLIRRNTIGNFEDLFFENALMGWALRDAFRMFFGFFISGWPASCIWTR
jgi:hypothetical protein